MRRRAPTVLDGELGARVWRRSPKNGQRVRTTLGQGERVREPLPRSSSTPPSVVKPRADVLRKQCCLRKTGESHAPGSVAGPREAERDEFLVCSLS
jgi:hypothetical protein